MVGKDCLVTYLSTKYEDAFALTGIILVGNIAEFLILYPLFPMIVASQKTSLQSVVPFNISQISSDVPLLASQDHPDDGEERELQQLVESTKTETFFGLKFQSYLGLVAFVYAAFAVSILLLILSLDDPRPIWKYHGWKQAIGAQELLVVGLLNGVVYAGSFLNSLIEEVLKRERQYPGYLYPHWSYYVLKVSQNGSLISLIIVFCVYYPYMVTYLLLTCFLVVALCAMALAYICSGIVFFCVYCWVVSIVQTLMKSDGAQDLGDDHDVVANQIAQTVTVLAVYYVLLFLAIVLTFLVSGGQTGRPICVHSQKGIGLAVLSNYSGIFIGILTFVLKKVVSMSENDESGSSAVNDFVDETVQLTHSVQKLNLENQDSRV